jgi:hypothetical protein
MKFAPELVGTYQDSEGGGERHCSSPRRLLRRGLERRIACLDETRRRIGQPLTLDADESAISPSYIIDTQRDPVVVPEVELGGVPMQMGLGDVEVTAVDPALEDREVIFGGVGVPEIGANVFLRAVVDRAMPGKLPPDRPIDGAFVSHQITGLIHVRGDDRLQGLGGNIRDAEAPDSSVAFNQREYRRLRRNLAFPVRGFAADKSFVAFNNLIDAAKRTDWLDTEIAHGLADAMPEKPRSFQPALKGPLKLASANTLFRRTEQIDGLQPQPHRHVAGFENSADLNGERFAAGVALTEADPVGLSLQPADMFLGCAAVRTNRTIRPQPRFDICISSFFAMEMGSKKVGLHG